MDIDVRQVIWLQKAMLFPKKTFGKCKREVWNISDNPVMS